MEFSHTPVLLNEVIDGLNIRPSGIYLDLTLGGGGHSFHILEKLKDGLLVGFDKDRDAISASSKRLSQISKVFKRDDFNRTDEKSALIIKSDFKKAPEILKELGITEIDGILIDLGVSSYQLDCAERGFSFKKDAPLDMRMDQSQTFTAQDIIDNYSQEQLINLFRVYGEEEYAVSIAKNIVHQREISPITTTRQLNEIIENSMPKKVVFSRNGASKKVFQALRIEVNCELDGLKELIQELVGFLRPQGRFCIISFHSLEDRIVKNVFKEFSTNCICPPNFPKCVCGHKASLKLITHKPIIASEEEQQKNSRSTCAKLRIAEKI
ncbi:MAG: 16S rRNA (cytosine(1402)-N(4))-methyltransferase RsmH [Christensenellales bacterium]